jgi:hypothetical protein
MKPRSSVVPEVQPGAVTVAPATGPRDVGSVRCAWPFNAPLPQVMAFELTPASLDELLLLDDEHAARRERDVSASLADERIVALCLARSVPELGRQS